MKELIQLKSIDDIKGLKILKAYYSWEKSVTLFFEGNRYFHIRAAHGYEGDIDLITGEQFDPYNYIEQDMIDLGFLTEEDVKKHREKKETKQLRFQRLQYERLKAKFEK